MPPDCNEFLQQCQQYHGPIALAKAAGGHDPKLRAMGMEGAEDLLLQLNLSLVGSVGCCKEALVGYRMHSGNMSLGYERAFRSNLKALELIRQKAPMVPEWVFKLGRARVVGYVPSMLIKGDYAKAFRSLRRLMAGQPGYTLLTLLLIAIHELRWRVTSANVHDPEIGSHFLDARPDSIVWLEHMMLTKRHRKHLDEADTLLAKDKQQWTDALCNDGNTLKDTIG